MPESLRNDDLINRAISFALSAHAGYSRKADDLPYIVHPLEVMCIVSTMTTDSAVMAAAVLHDVAEDTSHTLSEIYDLFGEKVGNLVRTETEDKMRDIPPSDSWLVRKENSLEDLRNAEDINVKILWLADKLANMRSFHRKHMKEGHRFWEVFNMKDPKMQGWYYSAIRDMTSELSDTAAWKEYSYLVNEVFGGLDDEQC